MGFPELLFWQLNIRVSSQYSYQYIYIMRVNRHIISQVAILNYQFNPIQTLLVRRGVNERE